MFYDDLHSITGIMDPALSWCKSSLLTPTQWSSASPFGNLEFYLRFLLLHTAFSLFAEALQYVFQII